MRNKNNNISVIYIIREEIDFIEESIQSLIKQKNIAEIFFLTNYDIELNSLLKGITDTIRIEILKRKYLVENINYAISIAKSEFISILGSDEIIYSGALISLSKKLKENENCNIVWGFSNYIDSNNNFLGYLITDRETDFYQNLEKPYKEIRPSSFLIKKSVFRKLGLFNKRFQYHFFLEFLIRVYKYDRLSINSFPEIKSQIKIKEYNSNYFFNFDKDLELLDLSLTIANLHNNILLEKRIYYYSSIFSEDIFIKRISVSSISEKSKSKIFSLREEFFDDLKIQKDGLFFKEGVPIQIKSILNSRPDLIQKKFHLEENEELFCRWLIKYGFREYPSLLEDLGDKSEFFIWLNSKRKNDKLSRLNLAILNTNKILKRIWKEKNFKAFEIFLLLVWKFLPYRLPKNQNKFCNLLANSTPPEPLKD